MTGPLICTAPFPDPGRIPGNMSLWSYPLAKFTKVRSFSVCFLKAGPQTVEAYKTQSLPLLLYVESEAINDPALGGTLN